MALFHNSGLPVLALTYPAIDNHAHPLLKPEYRDSLPFEGVISEATDQALIEDSPTTLACLRATRHLGYLLGLPMDATWEDVKAARKTLDYLDLCKKCMEETKIHCILLDDGLGSQEKMEGLEWHDQFLQLKTKRIVRIETEAEHLLREIFKPHLEAEGLDQSTVHKLFQQFTRQFEQHLAELVQSAESRVVGFKSVVCYRTGLDVSLGDSQETLEQAFHDVFLSYRQTQKLRIQSKPFNDHVVRSVLDLCGRTGKPIQFHTGLGDSDLSLKLASPAHLQPLIKEYPKVKFILLHASYPFTREAGYLTAVYQNVYLDFGEIFPFVSASGQKDTIRQVLELCPTNKIMFSTDGHFWPESYYLGTLQARITLCDVLQDAIRQGEVTEVQAIEIIKAGLFKNANRIYGLGFGEPEM